MFNKYGLTYRTWSLVRDNNTLSGLTSGFSIGVGITALFSGALVVGAGLLVLGCANMLVHSYVLNRRQVSLLLRDREQQKLLTRSGL